MADLFGATIGGKLAALGLVEDDMDSLTGSVHGALVDAASEVLGRARRRKRPWMTNDILDLCDRRGGPRERRTG